MVVEILPPSNTVIEMERKFNLYREAGVRKYCAVNPEEKSVSSYIFRDGQIFTRTLAEGKDLGGDFQWF
jgi:Uma2 family endonuclease